MRRFTCIFLIISLCAAFLILRARRRHARAVDFQPVSIADESTDVAATLRSISASEADAPTKG